jgi:hypothetical protein
LTQEFEASRDNIVRPCLLKKNILMALVTHACKPSYSGGTDQEDHSFEPAWANSSRDLISKKVHHRKGLVEWLKV